MNLLSESDESSDSDFLDSDFLVSFFPLRDFDVDGDGDEEGEEEEEEDDDDEGVLDRRRLRPVLCFLRLSVRRSFLSFSGLEPEEGGSRLRSPSVIGGISGMSVSSKSFGCNRGFFRT